uniref:ARAD1A05962p n=1 Tax=Blastobotrys adeninivorans TaxID=409370 RepID=A0A060T324_BLAAD
MRLGLGRVAVRTVRHYSTGVEPPLARAQLRKLLFEFKVPLSYKKVVETYHAASGPNSSGLDSVEGVSGAQMMTLKRILETHRRRSGLIQKGLVEIENNLVERAAELSDKTAITLLARKVMEDAQEDPKQVPEEDRVHADKLLTELMDANFPLAFKASGDLAYKQGFVKEAEKFYRLSIEQSKGNEDGLDSTLRTECYRNIGLICFNSRRITDATGAFLDAIATTEDEKQVIDCHFYLGQIFESDKHRARYHLENCASHGLKEAFAPLGFLVLNYFNEPKIALHWFSVGKEAGDLGCLIGLFDTHMRLEYFTQAQTQLAQLQTLLSKEEGQWDKFVNSRKKSIDRLALLQPTEPSPAHSSEDFTESPQLPPKDRWNF